MKTHVVKTTPEASLSEAVDLMDIYQVNSLPVVNADGRLCGIIAEHDIAQTVASQILPQADDRLMGVAGSHPFVSSLGRPAPNVGAVMEQNVVWASEDADVSAFARLFFVNDFTRMPVLDAGGGVIGTLNRVDILQALFEKTLPGACADASSEN